MSRKSVKITLDQNSQTGLKKNGYALCFAKKVNDEYNVVWKSHKKYLANNTLSWTPQFELFGTNTYEESITVQADTNTVPVELGQKSTLNEEGIMKPAVSGGNPLGLTMINEYGPIHSGVNQVCVMNGEETCTPIYVSKAARASGNILLTPKEKVMVWFQSNVETSTIFEEARSNSIEIDLTNTDTRTVSYDFESGKWAIIG